MGAAPASGRARRGSCRRPRPPPRRGRPDLRPPASLWWMTRVTPRKPSARPTAIRRSIRSPMRLTARAAVRRGLGPHHERGDARLDPEVERDPHPAEPDAVDEQPDDREVPVVDGPGRPRGANHDRGHREQDRRHPEPPGEKPDRSRVRHREPDHHVPGGPQDHEQSGKEDAIRHGRVSPFPCLDSRFRPRRAPRGRVGGGTSGSGILGHEPHLRTGSPERVRGSRHRGGDGALERGGRVGPWFYTERAPIHHFEYRGRPYEIHLSIALANSGPLQLELIQQRNDAPSLYREFLDAGQEGLQHIAYWTEDFDADRARALEAGSRSGTRGGSATTAPSPTSIPRPTPARSSSSRTWAGPSRGSSSTSAPPPIRGTGRTRSARSRPKSPDRAPSLPASRASGRRRAPGTSIDG